MSAQHTPGPWKVIEANLLPHSGDHVADMSNGLMVVPCFGNLGSPLADAHLIASAPEVLEHMLAIASYADAPHADPSKTLEYIRATAHAAITKATGSIE